MHRQACLCAFGGQGRTLLSCSIRLLLVPLSQALSLNLELGWQPESSDNLLVSAAPQMREAILTLYVGDGDLNSGPHAYTADAFAH